MDALLLSCRSGVQFHLGAGSLEETSELLHADTLFSALTNVYELAYGAAGTWVEWVQSGRIRFSSGLHCAELSWRGGEPVFFVPRPPLRYVPGRDEPSYGKRLRRVEYVSLGVLAEISAHLVGAETDDVPGCDLDLLALPAFGGRYACTCEEIAPLGPADIEAGDLVSTVVVPRVEVRSLTGEDAFYHASGITFNRVVLPGGQEVRGHFYVLVQHSLEPAEWQRFLACVRLLGDEGVGGERSAGYGWFENVSVEQVSLPGAEEADAISCTLAPLIPADGDELARALHYDLFLRGGGSIGEHGNPRLHRRRVRVMREGALFQGPVRGSLVDVTPDERLLDLRPGDPPPPPLLRSGLAFTLGLAGSAGA
jgi:CRISPR-associated protein Csm4